MNQLNRAAHADGMRSSRIAALVVLVAVVACGLGVYFGMFIIRVVLQHGG